ncbi:RHS repeat-associated core domain-containing protein [Chryseobacterium taeanense]|uniref:RHS repeat-associated core domain-containing protein n=1 Tax=Chryseobacterium taeanense TaxID=311334 RepID=A0A1G8FRX4_9FLAO|nr:DUF6443 domain-containing protein [Chryseobacterium taeanense]SDH84874.1 RHS repeat-associated core domain-containing protein [Chryseobacterium taeanense]
MDNDKLRTKNEKERGQKYFSLFTLHFSLFCLFFSVAAFAQTNLSADKNYIYTKTCLDADCVKKAEIVQYFDGLGRPVQSVAIKATPLGRDMVTPVEYNSVGKQVKDYLPIPQAGTSGGAFYDAPFDGVPAAYGTERIYSEKIYDNVYTYRVKQVVSLGNAWTQKPVNLGYDTNIAGEVKKYDIITGWVDKRTDSQILVSAPYPANQLMKSSVMDPDGNTTTEFQNGQGQTILVRKNDGLQNVDTYYLYNEYGQLAYVIPPLAVNTTLDQTTLDSLCYQYRYDEMGKLVEKKIPGKGWEYFIYDQQDRLIMTQDANMRNNTNTLLPPRWMFTKYDKYGRVVYTGFYNSSNNRAELQTNVNSISVNPENNEARTSDSFSANGMENIFYTQNAFPSENITVLSVNYYDTYPAYDFNPGFPTSVFGKPVITDAQNASINTKALPTMSLVKNIEDDNWTKSYIFYDEKARPISTYSINHLGGYTKTESDLDFAGVVKQTKAYHKRLNSDTEHIIIQTFEYDSQNRLKKQWHQVDSSPQELLSENSYNELSQLSNKKVGNSLQSIDYTYNVHGSLIKVNDPADLGAKLFGYEIKYFNPENTSASTGKYNGNIAEVTWKTAADNVKKRYNYQYDALNRLIKGIYSEPEVSVPNNNLYNETVSYDINSNIISMQRNAKGFSETAELIDNLAYTYAGNQLISVKDESGNYAGYPDTSAMEILYDDNGNMKDHKDKGILQIDYNILNLPDLVKFDQTYVPRDEDGINVNTKYLYRADGTKLKKVYTYGLGKANTQASTTTDYLDGFQYETKYSGSLSNPVLKFVPTSEGYYNFENNKYIYSYTDHLGNVRLNYTKNGSGTEIIEENNYYPFGMKHDANFISSGNPSSYNYQYNGKEFQKETGWSDYGARMYMADIGRWGVIDPLAEQYRRLTPYNYAANNPIMFIDPDGRKIKAAGGEDIGMGAYAGSNDNGMMSYIGPGNRAGILAFLGMEDRMGELNVLLEKRREDQSGGGGGSGPTPKSSTGIQLGQILSNFFARLFGTAKSDAKISTFLPGAAITRVSPVQVGTLEGSFETALKWEQIAVTIGAIARAGQWGIPLMLNGDSSHARGYDIPITGATDMPADEPEQNLYLYRIMRNVNGLPMVGAGLDKLGLRDRDVNNLSNSSRITNVFENGLSVTAGYGNVIPPNVPDFSGGKGTLFRIQASSLISYGLVGLPVPNSNIPNYGQIRPAVPMTVGAFRALIQITAPAWQPVK